MIFSLSIFSYHTEKNVLEDKRNEAFGYLFIFLIVPLMCVYMKKPIRPRCRLHVLLGWVISIFHPSYLLFNEFFLAWFELKRRRVSEKTPFFSFPFSFSLNSSVNCTGKYIYMNKPPASIQGVDYTFLTYCWAVWPNPPTYPDHCILDSAHSFIVSNNHADSWVFDFTQLSAGFPSFFLFFLLLLPLPLHSRLGTFVHRF